MVKPIGPICNLDCTYCYYVSKKDLFANEADGRMPERVLEKFIRQYIAVQNVQQIDFTWQGGEPTLLGIDFFEEVVHLQKLYCPPTKQVFNTLQTNGTLLDDEWCEFLRANKFLVGLSVDGPKHLHDRYRKDKKQQSTLDKVLRGAELLKKYGVKVNTLTVVNRTNGQKPLEVYRYLRDELGSKHIQFIPCVEPKDFTNVAPQHWDKDKLPRFSEPAARPGSADSVVTDWSVAPDDYGNFLCLIFDEWLENDIGEVFVRMFDATLANWMRMPSSDCCFSEVCGKGLVLEHDGSVYSCDHYVYPEYKLGNIKEKPLAQMQYSERQIRFGLDKTDMLPRYCRDCKVQPVCNGECPKNRFLRTPDGESDLNYLCTGLKKFFNHVDPWMKLMAKEIRAGRTADNVMKMVNKSKSTVPIRTAPRPSVKLNAKCPCGSGRKYKKCCYPKDRERSDKTGVISWERGD
jgi:uncharacterized protein